MEKKKNVAILTLYHKNYNYGGQLQAFALWKVIEKLGYKCDQISFERDRKKILPRKIRALFKMPKKNIIGLLQLHLRRRKKKTSEQLRAIKNNYLRFDEFMNQISHTEIVNSATTYKLNSLYDCFIVGSDQVWNPEFVSMDYFFDFVNDDKPKLSYAASIRLSNFEKKEAQIISKLLNRFEYISVREETSVELLKNIGVERNVSVAIDPTMLLSVDEWEKIIREPKVEEKYIVLYLIRDKKSIIQLRRYARKYNYKIISISEPAYSVEADKDFIQIQDGVGPKEFLGLIKNSEFVFANSFHGTVFSIIFNKQFYVYGDLHTDYRKKTLLKEFGLLDRCIDYDVDLETLNFDNIDYTNINELLNEKRKYDMNVLANQLQRLCKD